MMADICNVKLGAPVHQISAMHFAHHNVTNAYDAVS